MIIITLAGGIGNQILQYCLYLKLRTNSTTILYRKPNFLNDHHGEEIENLFPNIEKCFRANVFIDGYIFLYERLLVLEKKMFSKLSRGIISWLLPVRVINFPHYSSYTFIDELPMRIYDYFSFPEYNESNIDVLNQIENSNSVAVHVRRGDYMNNLNWRIQLGELCDMNYYNLAMGKIEGQLSDVKYFLFSDDTDWLGKNFVNRNMTIVSNPENTNSCLDLFLMSRCKHIIMANSTFSLTAAWLMRNPNKIVIGPKKWTKTYGDDRYLKFIKTNWIVIPNIAPSLIVYCKINIKEDELRKILKQTYSDFSLVLNPDNNVEILDERVSNIFVACESNSISLTINESNLYEINDKSFFKRYMISKFKK